VLRVFGLAEGSPAAAVDGLTVERDQTDPRSAHLHWRSTPGACGYLVRWGVRPDQCYCSQLIYDQTAVTLHCLHRDLPYWFRIEAWNRSGIGDISKAVACPVLAP
jgi:xylan 1,4-beta-xylosidase